MQQAPDDLREAIEAQSNLLNLPHWGTIRNLYFTAAQVNLAAASEDGQSM